MPWLESCLRAAAQTGWHLVPIHPPTAAQDVHQGQLETVVPGTEGTPLLVLHGQFRGRRARLLKRNTETGLAAVQVGGVGDEGEGGWRWWHSPVPSG